MITVADARTELGAASSADRVIGRLIDEATATLGRELGRYLGPIALQVELKCGGQAPGHPALFTDFDPVVSETYPMTVETRASQFDAFAALASDYWFPEGRMISHRSRFTPGRGNTRISYYAGYDVGTGPGELMDLVRRLVVMKYHQRDTGPDNLLSSETIGDYSYTRRDLELLGSWSDVVDRWRWRLV